MEMDKTFIALFFVKDPIQLRMYYESFKKELTITKPIKRGQKDCWTNNQNLSQIFF